MEGEQVEVDGRALLSGLIAGIVASAFSIGPLLLALLGYSITEALFLSQYWLYTVLAGVLMALASLIFISTNKVMQTKRAGKIRRIRIPGLRFRRSDVAGSAIVFVSTFLAIVYLITPATSLVVFGSPAEIDDIEVDGKNYRHLTLRIEGMVCPFCANGIQKALIDTPGIISAKVSLPDSGVVIYDPSRISKEEIVKLPIFSSYYSAEAMEDRPA